MTIAPAPAAAPPAFDDEGRGYRVPGKLSHLPPLDGIRGLGIPFVFLYHHEAVLLGRRFGGGFLTVSMFFTLSGFLITRLLLQEHDNTGTLGIKKFYARRFRRLMPASLIVLVLIAQVWWLSPPPNGGMDFRSWFAALTYWENWHLIFADQGYGALFSDASPVQHMWSLSLEEQVYILFPLMMLGLLRWTAVRPHLTKILTVLSALGFLAGWYWNRQGGPERAYYALEARSAEFMVGAAFAVFWLRSSLVPPIARFMRSQAGTIVAGLTVAASVVLWYSVGLRTTGLFPVWVAVNSVVTCVTMGYASADAGVGRFLNWKPFTFMGQLSYGLYLVHWPVFLYLNHERVGVTSWLLLVIRVAVTFAITLAIYHLVENPVRLGKLWKGRTFTVACVVLAVAGLGFAAMNEPSKAKALVDEEAVELQRRAVEALPVLPADAPTRSAVDQTLPARVLVVGDSQAWAIGARLGELWGDAAGVQIVPSPGVGCGLGVPTPIRYLGVEYENGRDGCQEWRGALPAIVARLQPQMVMIIGGFGDVADHRIPGSDEWQHIGEPAYDEWLTGQMRTFIDEMAAGGAHVLWFTVPHVATQQDECGGPCPEEDPVRIDRYNELIEQISAGDSRITVADLAGFAQSRPGGEFDPVFRPDGAHIDLPTAPDLVDWLAEQIRAATPPS